MTLLLGNDALSPSVDPDWELPLLLATYPAWWFVARDCPSLCHDDRVAERKGAHSSFPSEMIFKALIALASTNDHQVERLDDTHSSSQSSGLGREPTS